MQALEEAIRGRVTKARAEHREHQRRVEQIKDAEFNKRDKALN